MCTSGTFHSYSLGSEAAQVNGASGCPRLREARGLLEEQLSTAFCRRQTCLYRCAQARRDGFEKWLAKLDLPHCSCTVDFSKYKDSGGGGFVGKLVRGNAHLVSQINEWDALQRVHQSEDRIKVSARLFPLTLPDHTSSHGCVRTNWLISTRLHLLGQENLHLPHSCRRRDFGALMWFPAELRPASTWAEV